ncbi:hypothetical protein GTP23_01760 [Pseudoduganella sp. FT93W]|uniref:AAA family ATPase n=1 Tax=Duganella fentianensis TaxID=2692177 RepID=A0A845HS51_9BURK|nr:hypothetical protein [Duganella fentianensis]MYN43793.1 hypothetical protein [Duganella fentianensis]
MIVAIAGQGDAPARTLLALNLALLRARAGRRVLLLEADPQQAVSRWAQQRQGDGLKPRLLQQTILGGELGVRIAPLQRSCHDIVLHTEGCDSPASRAALIAAATVVVPIRADQVDLGRHYPLIARLNAARMFNPRLRVLFVIIGDGGAPARAELAAIRNYVSHVMAASLAHTVLHADALGGPDAQCVCEVPERAPHAAAEMKELYREVFVVHRLAVAA